MKQQADTDEMPPDIRQCVHEYGWPIVRICLDTGVTSAAKIHLLVREIWDGARQPGQKRNREGTALAITIDWILLQSGSTMSADTLARCLWERGYVILPNKATETMVNASKETISGGRPGSFEIVTKTKKHQRRLDAALEAVTKKLWPCVFREGKRK